ncbi:hypothetical protein FRB93_004284 [Tulasnella sp. JGI-2019a]|nr:hypothetical protein FRB93_004284 [Tulasnella sp. JGI-2019a]
MNQDTEKAHQDPATLLAGSQTFEIIDEVRFAVAQADWNRLRALSVRPGGFGVQGRKEAWPFLLHARVEVPPATEKAGRTGVEPEKKPEPNGDTDAAEVALDGHTSRSDPEETPHPDERQVKLDTNRSFVMYPQVSEKQKLIHQAKLQNLIAAVLRKRRKLGYFQGYHDIISVLYLTLPASVEDPSPLLVSCSEKLSLHRLRDSMGAGLDPLVGLLRTLKRLLLLADPELADIVKSSSPLPYFALSNLLTLFSHDVPTLPLIQRIFDFLLCRPPIFVVYLEAALIISRKQEIMKLAEEGEEGMMHAILSQLPDMAPDGLEDSETQRDHASSSKSQGTSRSSSRHPPESSLRKIDEVYSVETGTRGRTERESWATDLSVTSPDATVVASEDGGDGDERDTPAFSDVSSVTGDTDVTLRSPPTAPPPEYTEKPRRLVSPQREATSSIPVSRLLAEADMLYLAYPPSHPSIALDEIMGPNSVVSTWSEKEYLPSESKPGGLGTVVEGKENNDQTVSSCLPSDDAAEDMVTEKLLVVLPYNPMEDMEVSEDDDDDYKPMKGGSRAPRKRRPSLSLINISKMDKRTILTGMVLLLGVGLALYLKSDRRSMNADANLLQAQLLHWKQWAGWIGGIVLGVGGMDDEL